MIIYIEDFMETQFCTICEDESPVELSEVINILLTIYINNNLYILPSTFVSTATRSHVE